MGWWRFDDERNQEYRAEWVELFTDGACSGNPGPGVWGALLRCRGGMKRSCPAAKRTPPTTAWSCWRSSMAWRP